MFPFPWNFYGLFTSVGQLTSTTMYNICSLSYRAISGLLCVYRIAIFIGMFHQYLFVFKGMNTWWFRHAFDVCIRAILSADSTANSLCNYIMPQQQIVSHGHFRTASDDGNLVISLSLLLLDSKGTFCSASVV